MKDDKKTRALYFEERIVIIHCRSAVIKLKIEPQDASVVVEKGRSDVKSEGWRIS